MKKKIYRAATTAALFASRDEKSNLSSFLVAAMVVFVLGGITSGHVFAVAASAAVWLVLLAWTAMGTEHRLSAPSLLESLARRHFPEVLDPGEGPDEEPGTENVVGFRTDGAKEEDPARGDGTEG